MRPLLAAIVFAAVAAAPAAAQKIDIAAIKAQAAAGASEFAELKAMLADPDTNIRLATFDAMVAHGDPSLYEIAVSTAIADSDEVIRARALWEILARTPTIIVLVDPEGTIDDTEIRKKLQETYQGRISFGTTTSDKAKGCVNLTNTRQGDCNNSYGLAVSGTKVNFVYANQYLDGILNLEGDGVLRGVVRNTYLKTEFPVEVPLR